jgi:hypothetical protein
MAGLQSSYTQYFNRRHERVGHLFQGRYKAFLVEEDPYALALLRYIHENPVKARIADRPEQYAWSSDRFYRRGKGPEWLDLDRMLRMLGGRRAAAIRAYLRLMREEVEEPYEQVPSWGQAVKGDEAFADRVLQAAGEPPVVPKGVTVEVVASLVARDGRVSVAAMRGAGQQRAASLARLITAWLGREAGKIPVARVAKYFGRDTSTIIRGLARFEARKAADHSLHDRTVRLLRQLGT